MKNLLEFNPETEVKKITGFLKKTYSDQKAKKIILGLSGGIDSLTVLNLLLKAVPKRAIVVVHLPYSQPLISLTAVESLGVAKENIQITPIKDTVLKLEAVFNTGEKINKLRLGNLMARLRMIRLYDLAKKYQGLVAGTENRSEHWLGYFTRFGDQASDLEPIRHLYKTQVYQLARYLGISENYINQKPSANLWTGQTDEGEFGFTYKQADPVLYLHFDRKIPVSKISALGYEKASKIIGFAEKNHFKHKVPYHL